MRTETLGNPNAKSVYIAVLNQGWIRPELSYILTNLTHNSRYNLILDFPAEKPISFNRNKIVQDFLKTECDYLMMIDSDIVPPKDILNLVDFDKDVIGGLCFAFMDNKIVPLVLRKNSKKRIEAGEKPYRVMEFSGTEGLVKCDAIGTGCIVIARRVLEKVKHQPFCNQYDEKGIKKLGLDLSFCRKAQKAGFEIYCHLDYPCSHWVTLDLKNIFLALLENKETFSK